MVHISIITFLLITCMFTEHIKIIMHSAECGMDMDRGYLFYSIIQALY